MGVVTRPRMLGWSWLWLWLWLCWAGWVFGGREPVKYPAAGLVSAVVAATAP